MSKKMLLTVAAMIAMGSATTAFAQQQEYDRTGDHMNSYGPVLHQTTTETHANRPAGDTQQRPATTPIDRTQDHLFYYGPVAR
jgi:hypothetical protein